MSASENPEMSSFKKSISRPSRCRRDNKNSAEAWVCSAVNTGAGVGALGSMGSGALTAGRAGCCAAGSDAAEPKRNANANFSRSKKDMPNGYLNFLKTANV